MGRWIEPIDAWAGPWSEAMVRASWQGGVALALVWAWCRAVPRTPAAVQCWLWRLGYVKLLVALLWATPVDLPALPAAQVSRAAREPGAISPVESAGALPGRDDAPPHGLSAHDLMPGAQAALTEAVTPAPVRPSFASILLVAWLAGVAVYAARTGRAYAAAARLRSRCQPLDDFAINDAVADLCARLGLRRAPRVVVCAEDGGPLLTGLF